MKSSLNMFFNTVQLMNLVFCKKTDVIEQNNLFRADFSFESLIWFF